MIRESDLHLCTEFEADIIIIIIIIIMEEFIVRLLQCRWRFGVAVTRWDNAVVVHRARLVLRCVTAFG